MHLRRGAGSTLTRARALDLIRRERQLEGDVWPHDRVLRTEENDEANEKRVERTIKLQSKRESTR